MKSIRTIPQILAVAAALALSPVAFGQTTVVTGGGATSVSTTTTAGTISEFSPDTIIVRSESAPEPIRYSYTKTTTYIDDSGAPVSLETVKSGLPVTVHYVKEGDRMVASRVIVHRSKSTTTGGAAVIEKKTTRTEGAPVVEERKTSTTTTTTEGKKKDKD